MSPEIGFRLGSELEAHPNVRAGRLIVEHEEIMIVNAGIDYFPAGIFQTVL